VSIAWQAAGTSIGTSAMVVSRTTAPLMSGQLRMATIDVPGAKAPSAILVVSPCIILAS
jgi:hypothetical protein